MRGGKRNPGPGKKIGRPALAEPTRPRTVRLSDAQVEFVLKNIYPELSEAIRTLITQEMERKNEHPA